MFSKLRPHHRRTTSTPTSPADQTFEPLSHTDHAHPQLSQDAHIPEPTNRPPPPPLQSIARVQSAEESFDSPRRGYERDSRPRQADASDTRGRDTYSISNHQRLHYAGSQRPESAGNAVPRNYTSPQYARQQSGMNQGTRLPEPSPGSVTSPDIQGQYGQNNRKAPSSLLASTPTLVEPAQSRPGRARLNLLNPMSLLARRRTSQAVEKLAPQSLVSSRNVNNFNETFDPRIRGTVVHDFSAPRAPRRNLSAVDVRSEGGSASSLKFQRSPNVDLSSADENVASPWSGGNHTPVFTENFEEEQYPNAGPHVRKASDLTDLPLPQPPYAKGVQKPVEPNLASKGNDGAQKQYYAPRRINTQKPVPDIPQMPDHPPPVPPKTDVPLPIAPQRISVNVSATPPKAPSSRKGRSRNDSEISAKDAAIPKHMKSTSSRFSFDMIGAAEQERLLEDRHRQKALEKKAEKNEDEDEDENDRIEDEFEHEYDYDYMEDDDGLEERIPGINADLDDDDYPYDDLEEPIPGSDEEEDPYQFSDHEGNLGGFTFQQSSSATPMSPTSPVLVSTPRDADGAVIGFAMTQNSPWAPQGVNSSISPASPMFPDMKPPNLISVIQGPGLQGISTSPAVNPATVKPPPYIPEEFPRPATLDDDDLYFDDGIIGEPSDGDDVEFDESVFDNIDTDQYGRPLKSLSLPTLYSSRLLTADLSPSFNEAADGSRESTDLTGAISPVVPTGGLAPQPSISGHVQSSMGPPPPPQQDLTQDTLAAYQSALAAAAFVAAANGKFRRDSTNASEQEDTQPGLVTDSSHTSHYEPFSPSFDQMEDDFDYNDILEDDPIIAAANAEALANDDDGFYGQEFGFYSAPASNESQFGGYFGPRGTTGINRGPSNRIVSREPNLTPITERSEYSNRNSFMSLAMHGGNSSLISPGLAQLTNMLRSPMDYEGDISFDALLKLRRGAWGGSQASLYSSNGGSPKSVAGLDDGSPVGPLPPWAQAGAANVPSVNANGSADGNLNQQCLGRKRRNSVHSDGASATSSSPASPMMAVSFSPLDGIQEKERERDDHENGDDKVGRNGAHHIHPDIEEVKKEALKTLAYTGSAESISIPRSHEDSLNGQRWILERRRTGEGGQVETEREIIRGGIRENAWV